ncbi:MAG: hypothetical protein OXB89_08160, partial [Anaerolineaceae bacterium]|nr:hypothetical protein [Anaerolineaceae bacterium]
MAETNDAVSTFRLLLLTALGQALGAAGYQLAEDPVSEAAGRFQFRMAGESEAELRIEFQVLVGTASEWAPQMPSRFRVTLFRQGAGRALAALVVQDFGVAILPSADHWWSWQNSGDLGAALAEAGHLLFGFGIPWLNGEL